MVEAEALYLILAIISALILVCFSYAFFLIVRKPTHPLVLVILSEVDSPPKIVRAFWLSAFLGAGIAIGSGVYNLLFWVPKNWRIYFESDSAEIRIFSAVLAGTFGALHLVELTVNALNNRIYRPINADIGYYKSKLIEALTKDAMQRSIALSVLEREVKEQLSKLDVDSIGYENTTKPWKSVVGRINSGSPTHYHRYKLQEFLDGLEKAKTKLPTLS